MPATPHQQSQTPDQQRPTTTRGTGFHPVDPANPTSGPATDELDYARGVCHAEMRAIGATADLLGSPFLEAVSLIVRCAEAGGTVLVTGLGKSGLIGAKVSATLASLGIPSHPVHPAEAAHGDLGRFRSTDTVICLSRSGETDEVVNLAAILRQDGLPIISITGGTPTSQDSNPTKKDNPGRAPSSLERLASVSLHLGDFDEAGTSETSPTQGATAPTQAPTASTAATLALGDALALTAARRRRFTDADFARRHPGGTLGGLLRPVVDILRVRTGHNCPTVRETTPILDAIAAGDGRRAGAVLVVAADGTLAGIFTDADLRRKLSELGPGDDRAARGGWMREPIESVMTRNPVSLPDSALVRDAVLLTRERRLDEIPIVDSQGRPIGVLDVQDLIAMRLVRDETDGPQDPHA
ncbi:MAG: SIS domain-containing protein [Planctomycetota bacterium]|nr:SIS domain-containing protein [Planctomycetota bacterium]